MPVYPYRCNTCGHVDTMIRHVYERDRSPLCRKCGGRTTRIYEFTGLAWSPTSGGYSGPK
jgi:putative FmdB family regulatory protein